MVKAISKFLKTKENTFGIEKAESLANISDFSNLHLRNLGLTAHDIGDIMKIIEQEKEAVSIMSISFSYNPIGDIGASFLAKQMPPAIREIGLVDCGIGDQGGTDILQWMRRSRHLQMICLERNCFSEDLKKEFNAFQKQYPQIVVIH